MIPRRIDEILQDHTAAVGRLFAQRNVIEEMAHVISDCILNGGTLYLCGNGGSAADCQHLAAEFVGRYLRDRSGYAAVALTTDTSVLTAVGNDYGFDRVFERQVDALMVAGDVLLCLSTSGRSPNVVRAARHARDCGFKVLALTGENGGELVNIAHFTVRVPHSDTPRVQECHILIGHALCELAESDIEAA